MIANHKPLNAGFFRGVNSHELFKAFFDKYGAWESMKLPAQPTYDDIRQGWEALVHQKKRAMKEALLQVNDIGREDGMPLLLSFAKHAGLTNFRDLTPQKLAMTLRLYYRSDFLRAYDYYNLEHVDNLKVLLGAEPAPCEPTEADKQRFKEKLRVVLKKAAHGTDLKLEEGPHPEGNWVMVVPHEQTAKPDYEFDKEAPGPDHPIKIRDRRPVHDLLLMYSPQDGILKLKAGKGPKKAMAVAAIFATELLHKPASHFGEGGIQIDSVARPGFKINRLPGDKFEWATPTFIDYSLKSDGSVRRSSQIKNTDNGKRSVLSNLGDPLDDVCPLRVGIEFRFPGDRRKGRLTAMLFASGRTSLATTDRCRYVESILKREGLIHDVARQAGEPAVPAGQKV